jgi:glycosyltransferase involved in cell wall biosynthesis
MRIFQLVSSGGFYGLETVVLNLCRAFRQMGHQVTLCVFRNERNPQLELADQACASGLTVEVIPCRGQLDLSALNTLRKYLRAFRPDILHSHGYKADIYAWAANFGSSRTIVATAHNWTNASRALRVYGCLDKLILRRFDRVFCVSDDVREILLGAGVRPNRLVTARNGVDLSRFESAAAPALAEEIPENTFVVGMVGRLVRAKGFHAVLQVAPELLERYPQTCFVLVGAGPEADSLQELADSLGISSRVHFAGRRNDMPGVYRSFDMLVLPSLNEGTPMVILEAMASAVPVIATRVGAIPLIVENGRTGLLTDPGDSGQIKTAIETLLQSPHLRRDIGLAGHAWLAAYGSIQTTAELYVKHYADVC